MIRGRRWMRPWRQWPVRARMVVSVAALAAVALIASNTAATLLLRRYLLERVDRQLQAQVRGFERSSGPFPFPLPEGTPERSRPPAFGPDSQTTLYDADGRLLRTFGQPGPGWHSLGDVAARARSNRAFTVSTADGSWRVRATRLADGRYGVSAVSLREVEATEDGFLLIDVAVGALALLLMGAAAASVVRIGLRPLTRMQHTAAAIADGDLSQRVTDADPHTEAGQLGMALNTMLGRIEAALAEQAASEQRLRRLLADAAHELRTPLTSIQGFTELYRRGGAPPGPALDEAMGRVASEVSRMRLLVNDLLLLARLDEERPLDRHPVDLLAVAADAVRDAHVRVPTRFVALSGLDDRCQTFEPVTVLADESRIRQVVTNLLANALQHTPDDARVVVRVGRAGPDPQPPTTVVGPGPGPGPGVADGTADGPAVALAAIEVEDTGPGMAPEDAGRIFERLYRADPSRSRRHGGAGLGLAIVAAIITAHGGRIELRTAPGRGARFRVLLEALAPPVDDEDYLELEEAP